MFFREFMAIPEDASGYGRNEIPILQRHIRNMSQAHGDMGEVIAESSRFAVHLIRQQGGINPNARLSVFPEGPEGPFNEEAWLRVIGNLAVWHETDQLR
jgi:hypothetical protein